MINVNSVDYSNTPVNEQKKINKYKQKEVSKVFVSIITPFYNSKEVFFETYKSILQQSFTNFEWIIVNDNSDNEESIKNLSIVRGLDKRIRVFNLNENKGPSYARNFGVQKSKSKYIVFLDSDDLLEPTAIEKWVWFMESNPHLSFAGSYNIGFGAQNYTWNGGFHDNELFIQENRAVITSIIKREVFESIGGFDVKMRYGCEDWDFWLKCAENGYWGDTLPEYLNWYRRREDHSISWENWDNGENTKKLKNEFKKKYPKLFSEGIQKKPNNQLIPNIGLDSKINIENKTINKSKKRVLYILPWLTMGGADKFNLELIRTLTDRSWESTIVTTLPNENPWENEFYQHTSDIFHLSSFLNLKDYHLFINYLILSRDFDLIVLSNSEYGYKLLPYIRNVFPQIPLIDYNHMEEEYWNNGGFPQFTVNYKQFIDKSYVTSHHLKNWMVKRGMNSKSIDVCYINVNSKYWKPSKKIRELTRKKYKIKEDETLILFAARICAQKQPKVLADTIYKLSKKSSNFKLLVAGDGEDRLLLENLIDKYDIKDRIELLGRLPNSEIEPLLDATDIFFIPSLQEGIALTFYEAMSKGNIILGADVGGQKELVTKECGHLIQPNQNKDIETQEYVEILYKWIKNPNLRKKMGDASRKRIVEKFDLNIMTNFMEEAYFEVIKNHKTFNFKRNNPIMLAYNAYELTRLSKTNDEIWQAKQKLAKEHESIHNQFNKTLKELEDKHNWLEVLQGGKDWLEREYFKEKENNEYFFQTRKELEDSVEWHKNEMNKVKEFYEKEIKKIISWHESQYKHLPKWVIKALKLIFKNSK